MKNLNWKGVLNIFWSAALVLQLSGCSHILDQAGLRDETIYPPAMPIDINPPEKKNGSIYQAGYDLPFYRDHISSRRGDILTVRLEESTQGEKKAKLKANKEGNYDYTVPQFNAGKINAHQAAFYSVTDFNGQGESNQQNKLRGTISATVTQVLRNGNLMIQGESWVTINQGREYIRLTGIVRPYDIDPSNSISSQRITNARITYSGNGQVANATSGGLITQFLLKFFPY